MEDEKRKIADKKKADIIILHHKNTSGEINRKSQIVAKFLMHLVIKYLSPKQTRLFFRQKEAALSDTYSWITIRVNMVS